MAEGILHGFSFGLGLMLAVALSLGVLALTQWLWLESYWLRRRLTSKLPKQEPSK